MESLILNKTQLLQKIKRIAYEIYEQNYKETELVLAGLEENGYVFAEKLKQELGAISAINIQLVRIRLDKTARKQTEVFVDTDLDSLVNKAVIIVDDVLNTGRALAFSLQPFLGIDTAKLQTAVIVDRSHQLFPISADYVGYSLATTIKEHIEVSFSEERFGVYIH
ncbi:MAG TPA: phosphoribosyltransferase family protein [Cytophagaceae bacterium]|jgi:pyrimidine operon attenuation protein/uracil phosphoribosyltransferase